MYIAPNGDIQFYQNIPLDPSYRHVMKFASSEARDKYFDTYYATHAFSVMQIVKSQYTRLHRGVIKCNGDTFIFEQFNYMRFRNNITGGKTMWYYAFVTSVEYVNDNVTEVHFTIDVFTTFLPFVTFKQSFIERCHTVSDLPGEHILPEPDLNVSDYVYEPVKRINDDMSVISPETLSSAYNTMDGRPQFKNVLETAQPVDFQRWVYIIASTYMLDYGTHGKVLKNKPFQLYELVMQAFKKDYIKSSFVNVYNGLYFTVLYTSDEVNEFLTNSVDVLQGDESAGIVGIFMYPYDFIRDVRASYPNDRVAYPEPLKMLRIQTNTNWGNLNGNKIRNNKLYSYPFTYFTVTTHDGQKIDIKQENFAKWRNPVSKKLETPQFMWLTVFNLLSASPQSILFPGKNHWTRFSNIYNSQGTWQGETYENVDTNTSHKLSISSYPMCSYKTDAYMSWLAQNQGKLNIESTRDTVGLVNGFAGDILGMAGGGFNILQSGKQGAINPFSGVGQTALNAVQRTEDYFFNRWTREDNIRLAQNQPPTPHGSDSASADILSKSFGFRMWCVHLKPETAKIADDYFTMFGYNQQCYGVPNLTARKGFTYIKTKGVNLYGECPQEYLTLMRQTFDNGLTFWNVPASRLEQNAIKNEETPFSWILDYSLNDNDSAQLTDYRNYTLNLTKSNIENDFEQTEYFGVPVYTQTFSVPVPASNATFTSSIGETGMIYNSPVHLDIPFVWVPGYTENLVAQNNQTITTESGDTITVRDVPEYYQYQGTLDDADNIPIEIMQTPMTEVYGSANDVTLYINQSLVDELKDGNSEISYSWIYENKETEGN